MYYFSLKVIRGTRKKWQVLYLKQEMYKISLEHLVIADNKEASKTTGVLSERLKVQLEELPHGTV